MRQTGVPKTMVVDGFEVGCTVEQVTDARYLVQFFTVPQGALEPDLRRVWPAPTGVEFKTEAEAQKYGRYVLLGVERVSPSGKPEYSVI